MNAAGGCGAAITGSRELKLESIASCNGSGPPACMPYSFAVTSIAQKQA